LKTLIAVLLLSLVRPLMAKTPPSLLLGFTDKTTCVEAMKWGQKLPLLFKCTDNRRVRVFAAEYTGVKPVGAVLKEIENRPGLRWVELVQNSIIRKDRSE